MEKPAVYIDTTVPSACLEERSTPEMLQRRSELRILPLTPEVTDTADLYIRHKLMPADPIADAYHLAFASCYECEFLVSWNFRHLVNPSKFLHIRKINALADSSSRRW